MNYSLFVDAHHLVGVKIRLPFPLLREFVAKIQNLRFMASESCFSMTFSD